MHQSRDLRGWRVLDIIVSNGFYKLLENNEIGMIAENLWAGTNAKRITENGFIAKFVWEDFNEEVTDFTSPISIKDKWIF